MNHAAQETFGNPTAFHGKDNTSILDFETEFDIEPDEAWGLETTDEDLARGPGYDQILTADQEEELLEMRQLMDVKSDAYWTYLTEHPEDPCHFLTLTHVQQVDKALAQRFLTLLDEGCDAFLFQTFSDRAELKVRNADGKTFDPLAKVFYGTLDEHFDTLKALNDKGAGVFVTVNKDNGTGQRRNENITAIRAIFTDHDSMNAVAHATHDASLLAPHIVIESSPGKRHLYRLVEGVPTNEFKALQQLIAGIVHSDQAVCDLARVMRLPGFLHKKGDPHLVRIVDESLRKPYTLDEIKRVFSAPAAIPQLKVASATVAVGKRVPMALPPVKGGQDIVAGDRHGFLTRLCAALVRDGLSRDSVIQKAMAADAACCVPPKNDRAEVEAIVDWAIGRRLHEPQDSKIKHGLQVTSNSDWPELTPLIPEVEPAQAYPMDALGHGATALGTEMMSVIQAPDGLIGQVILSAQSLAAQGVATLIHNHQKTPPSLFLVTIGESGERKSSCQAVAFRPIEDFEKACLCDHFDAKERFTLELSQYQMNKKGIESSKSMKSHEKIEAILQLQKPKRPRERTLVVKDPTSEGLVKKLILDYPAPGLINDDAGQVLGGYSMNAENRMKTLALWCTLYDAGVIDRIRAKDDENAPTNGKYYGRRLSMHMMLQEIVARNLLSDQVAREQGYLARCLMAYPTSKIGFRPYNNRNLFETDAYGAYMSAMSHVIGTKIDMNEHGELAYREIQFSSDTARGWIGWHDHVEAMLKPDGDLASIRAWGARISENSKRIALAFAIFESPDANEVKVEHLDRAIKLMTFYANEAVRILRYFSTSPDKELAKKLIDWLTSQGLQGQQVTVKQIQNKGPSALRPSAETVRQVCRTLVDHGYMLQIDNTTYAVRGTLG